MAKRVLAAIVLVIAALAFALNAAGLAGIWMVRRPAQAAVATLTTFLDEKLTVIDGAMTRVSVRVDEGQQAIGRVNTAASQLGNRVDQNSPGITALLSSMRDDLAPKIADAREKAGRLRDAVLSVNAALLTIDKFGVVDVPTFSDELSAISERMDAAQEAVHGLREVMDDARTGVTANFVEAVTTRTGKIDGALAQVKSTTAKYQDTVAQKREQVSDVSQKLVRWINLIALALSAIFLTVDAGQVVLIRACWQCLRRSGDVNSRAL